jgi:hypothetical protein
MAHRQQTPMSIDYDSEPRIPTMAMNRLSPMAGFGARDARVALPPWR